MLMLASVASMIDQFNMPNIELLQSMGYAVDVACNFEKGSTCSDKKIAELKKKLAQMHVRCFQIDFARSVSHMNENMKALWQVEHLMKTYHYEFVHCHSPIGGVVGRLAGHKTGTKVIYTAHGFHFYDGAPKKNWLLYYPVEKAMSKYTDILITINKEDYKRAKEKFHAKKTVYIPGVGVDTAKFATYQLNTEEISTIRQSVGCGENDILLLSVGELNKNKNHEVVIRAMRELGDNVHYVIAGKGDLREYLEQLANECEVGNRVYFLGFVTNVSDWYKAADVLVFPSFREGLSLSLMEAMASGLPCVVSKIRGNTDLVDAEYFDPSDSDSLVQCLMTFLTDSQKREQEGLHNKEKIKTFDFENVLSELQPLYRTRGDRTLAQKS